MEILEFIRYDLTIPVFGIVTSYTQKEIYAIDKSVNAV